MDARVSIITGELESLNKMLAFDDLSSNEIKIIERFLLKMPKLLYFGNKDNERKKYFDFEGSMYCKNEFIACKLLQRKNLSTESVPRPDRL